MCVYWTVVDAPVTGSNGVQCTVVYCSYAYLGTLKCVIPNAFCTLRRSSLFSCIGLAGHDSNFTAIFLTSIKFYLTTQFMGSAMLSSNKNVIIKPNCYTFISSWTPMSYCVDVRLQIFCKLSYEDEVMRKDKRKENTKEKSHAKIRKRQTKIQLSVSTIL